MKKLLILSPLVLSTPLLAADQTLTSLPAAGALGGAELLYCVQAAADTKCTPTQMSTFTAAAAATLTNKTFDTAGAGNIFRINGTAIASVTGTGSVVLGTAPTITLANGTGLPISTGVSGLGAGVAAFLATPSSANFAAAVTGETGTGALVFSDSPVFTTALTLNGSPTFAQNVNGIASNKFQNLNAGSGAYTSMELDNDATNGLWFMTSSTNTTYGGAGSSMVFFNSSAGGNITFHTAGVATPRMQILSSGAVFIPFLTAAAGTPNSICQNNATKEITVNAATSCVVSSLAYKHDFRPLEGSTLPAILAMRPGSFFYNDSDRQRIGFASEYQAEVDPRLADGWDKDGHPRSLDQTATIAYLVRGMQELVEEIERLKAKQ
jgi:hypothetical protein